MKVRERLSVHFFPHPPQMRTGLSCREPKSLRLDILVINRLPNAAGKTQCSHTVVKKSNPKTALPTVTPAQAESQLTALRRSDS
jgi:hypothetical protein